MFYDTTITAFISFTFASTTNTSTKSSMQYFILSLASSQRQQKNLMAVDRRKQELNRAPGDAQAAKPELAKRMAKFAKDKDACSKRIQGESTERSRAFAAPTPRSTPTQTATAARQMLAMRLGLRARWPRRVGLYAPDERPRASAFHGSREKGRGGSVDKGF
jgi:hypothetical protein